MSTISPTRLQVKDLATRDGKEFSIRVGENADKRPRNAVILLPAIAGVNPYIESTAGQLMKRGYTVAIMDYFSRWPKAPDLSTHERIGEAIAAMDDREVLLEIEAAMSWLGSRGISDEAMGVLGFCIGGAYAVLSAASERPPKCSVAYYGLLEYVNKTERKPTDPMSVASSLKSPLLGHFGAQDRLISRTQIDQFTTRMSEANISHEVFTYEGAPHAFDEWFRPEVYRPIASAEAWTRTATFLDWHLCRSVPGRNALSQQSAQGD